MNLSEANGEVERFRRKPWKFQQTFLTPLKDLQNFVAIILSAFCPDQGIVTIDQVAFEPTNLLGLLASHAIAVQTCKNVTVVAVGREEIATLLESALGDWVDFLFVPTPERFAVYADHDEYITFFAGRRSDLNQLTTALKGNGFKAVSDYTRIL